jgi:hypothetical protein
VLVELLIPVVASRPGKELVFTTPKGGRIIHNLYWHHYGIPAVRTAQTIGLTKNRIRLQPLRRACWAMKAPDTRDTYFLDCELKRRSVRSIETLSSVMQPAALMDSFERTRGPRLFLVVSLMSVPLLVRSPTPVRNPPLTQRQKPCTGTLKSGTGDGNTV